MVNHVTEEVGEEPGVSLYNLPRHSVSVGSQLLLLKHFEISEQLPLASADETLVLNLKAGTWPPTQHERTPSFALRKMIPKSLRRIRNYLLNDLWRDAFDERGGLQCSCLGKLSQCLVEVFFNRLFEVESDIAEVYPIPEDVCHVFIRHKRTQRFVDKPHYLLLLKTKSQQAQERGLTPTKAKQNVSHLSTLLLLN